MGCGNSSQRVSPDVKESSLKCYATYCSRLNQLSDIPPQLQKELQKAIKTSLNASPSPSKLQIVLDASSTSEPLEDAYMRPVIEVLKQNHPVAYVRYSDGFLSEHTMTELGKVLRYNDSLQHLSLNSARLAGKGASALLKHLLPGDNTVLATLDLQNVGADDKAALSISHLMLSDCKLKSIDLSGNVISVLGQDALVSALRGNMHVRNLNLDNNTPSLGEAQRKSIDSSLCRNQAAAEAIELLLESVFCAPLSARIPLSKIMKSSPFLFNDATHGITALASDRTSCMPLQGTISGAPFSFGVAEMTGRRVQMQDEVLIQCHFDGQADEHVFGIFDGHGGTHCSRFVGANFSCILRGCVQRNGRADPMNNLREAFKELDEQCTRYDIPHGSCAVVCYFVGSKVFCAGLGDSRAVLCRGSKGSAKAALMADVLKPSDECERQRIQKLGGLVTENGRVAGVLGVSRALGDKLFQPFVSAAPQMKEFDLQQDDPFVVMGCDGVWDIFSDQEAVDLLIDIKNPEKAAAVLRSSAYVAGSKDNISALVIRLQP